MRTSAPKGNAASTTRLPVQRKGHAPRLLHSLGRIEHLDGQQVARLVVVEDHTRLVLVTLGHAIAATKSRGAGGKLSSDGLVPVDSALGRHASPKERHVEGRRVCASCVPTQPNLAKPSFPRARLRRRRSVSLRGTDRNIGYLPPDFLHGSF